MDAISFITYLAWVKRETGRISAIDPLREMRAIFQEALDAVSDR